MIRKAIAIIVTIITLLAIKETVSIFMESNPADNYRKPMIVLTLSITVPLILLSLWLWISKAKPNKPNQE